jgi:hypothetical protein
MVQEDDLLAGARLHDLPVHVAQPVLAIDLDVPDGVALAPVALGAVRPAEPGECGVVGVIDDSGLALREWDVLHEVNLLVAGDGRVVRLDGRSRGRRRIRGPGPLGLSSARRVSVARRSAERKGSSGELPRSPELETAVG